MGLIDRLFKNQTPSSEKGKKKNFRHSSSIKRTPEDRIKMEMDTLVSAAEDAVDVYNPNRIDILTIYKKSWKDAQVISEREKAESFVTVEPYELRDESGQPNEDAKKLFARPWFEQVRRFKLYEEFWGYTLMEFQQQDENGEFEDVKIFPRMNINPFSRQILLNPLDKAGISYRDHLYEYFLLETGDPEELGKLEAISREVILKNYARSDWSEYNERFGKPMLDYGIDTDEEDEIARKEEMAQNFGRDLYIIRGVEEEVTIHEFSGGSAGGNFEKSARFCDEQIAKLMNGQVGTGDDKAFVGSAEVHERILTTFNKARLLRIQNFVNYELIPFLIYHGYRLEGYTFAYPILEESEQTPKAPEQNRSGKKKTYQPQTGLGFEYAGVIIPLGILSQGQEIKFKKDVAESLARKLFAGKQPVIDKEIFQDEHTQMQKALKTGWGSGFSVEYNKPDWEYIQNLRYNTAVFSAFKCNHQIKEAARLLVDDAGSPRTWKEFQQACLKVSEKYNQRWLRTEFNTAHTSAKFAKKWQEFEQDQDLYPNLTHVSVMDESTRPSHALLNGVTLPISDPHWRTYYPPLDWNCRCTVIQSDGEIVPPGTLPHVPEIFQNNVGITARIFDESHPFYHGISEAEKAKALYFVQQNLRPADEVTGRNIEFNAYPNEYKKAYFNADNGGFMVIHKGHRRTDNYPGEVQAVKAFAKIGEVTVLQDEPYGVTACDALINGIPTEIKVMTGHRNLRHRALKAVQQGAKMIVFNIKFDNDFEIFKRFNSIKKDTNLTIWYLKNGELKRWE